MTTWKHTQDGRTVELEWPEPIEQDGKWWETTNMHRPSSGEHYTPINGLPCPEIWKATNDFVCQGANLQEIVNRFRARFPDKQAAFAKGDDAVIAALQLQSKDLHENSSSIRSPS